MKNRQIQMLWMLTLLFLTAAVWLILGMVYTEHFILPFDRIELVLMPWKGEIPPDASLDRRLDIMQNNLDASGRVAHYALVTMIVAFAAFVLNLSIVYQQKQRRARENMLLVLKNQEIARRNEFIRYISATIGHEFKNNLGRIRRRIDLLSGLPSDAQSRISDTLDKLFADIDIFKKISDEREALLVEFTNIDLVAMLDGLTSQYGDLADITVDKNTDIPPIYGAPPLLKTVFENVFDNAIRYKKADQPRARIAVACTIDRDGTRRYATVSVRDEGVGMDEQQADHCFYKGKGAGERWGQGLYFAKYVVGLHAGRIRVGREHTAPGKGSEIIINLPLVEEALNV